MILTQLTDYHIIVHNKCCIEKLLRKYYIRAHHPHSIKSVRLVNAKEFPSKGFDDYCIYIRIDVEYHLNHVHTQKWSHLSYHHKDIDGAKALKMRTKMPIRHGVCNTTATLLFRLKPTANQ